MKNLILIFVCLLLFVPSQTAEAKSEENQQQLEEIDRYILRQRIRIENYYRGRLIELKQRAQSELVLLEVADKAVYADLGEQAEVAKTVLHINNYGYYAPWYLVDETERMLRFKGDFDNHKINKSPRWYTLTHGSSIAELTGMIDGNSVSSSTTGSTFAITQGWIDNGDSGDSVQNSPKRFAIAQSKITERKSEILAWLEWEVLLLERRKQYALTIGLAQLERRMKENILEPKPEATHGLVTGILYSTDKPSAIIDRTIVREWDTIHGVTVVKIYKDKVKFQRDGKRWEQKVQETPVSYWK